MKGTSVTRYFRVFCLVALLDGSSGALGQQVAPNPAAKMQVILLGTGFPRPSAERAGPATAVVVGEKVFVVDAGRGVVMRLAATEFPLSAIRAVFSHASAFGPHRGVAGPVQHTVGAQAPNAVRAVRAERHEGAR